MLIRAILFDIDGTLVDSNEQHVLAWQEVFRAEGLTFDAATIHAQMGKGADMLVPALVPGSDAAFAERLGDAHGEIFKRSIGDVRPFAGARALLARVADSGRRVVLASSAAKSEVDHYLALLDAGDLVAATTCADDVAHTKPAPDIFAAALAKVAPLGADAVVVVGDTPYDIVAAAACGIAAVGLLAGGFDRHALTAAGAAAVYLDAAALLAAFDSSPLNR